MTTKQPVETIYVTAQDFPIYCPGPKAPHWSMHPKVFLDLSRTGEATCPYCGAHYQLKETVKPQDHAPSSSTLETVTP